MIFRNKVVDCNDICIVTVWSTLYVFFLFICFYPVIFFDISSGLVSLAYTFLMSIGMAIFSTFAIIICFFGFLGQNTAGLRFKYNGKEELSRQR